MFGNDTLYPDLQKWIFRHGVAQRTGFGNPMAKELGFKSDIQMKEALERLAKMVDYRAFFIERASNGQGYYQMVTTKRFRQQIGQIKAAIKKSDRHMKNLEMRTKVVDTSTK